MDDLDKWDAITREVEFEMAEGYDTVFDGYLDKVEALHDKLQTKLDQMRAYARLFARERAMEHTKEMRYLMAESDGTLRCVELTIDGREFTIETMQYGDDYSVEFWEHIDGGDSVLHMAADFLSDTQALAFANTIENSPQNFLDDRD